MPLLYVTSVKRAASRPTPCPRRLHTGGGRTSRSSRGFGGRRARAASATRRSTARRGRGSTRPPPPPRGERERASPRVPVGSLVDPRLPLEPAAVSLRDVVRAGSEDVEDEAA